MKKYRPSVAGIIMDKRGRILIGERMNKKNAWQFPQGGVEKNESDEEALFREVCEEVGIKKKDLKIKEKKGKYKYDFTNKHSKFGNYKGQSQTYFLLNYSGDKDDIDLSETDLEFKTIKWIKPEDFKIKWLPGFKHKVYEKVFLDFFKIKIK